MKTFYISPEKIKVREGLERIRQDMGDIKALARSLKEDGQIHPILVTEDLELIAGGRRLEACKEAKIDVLVMTKGDVDSAKMRSLELQENVMRKKMTPYEEVNAIAEIHRILKEENSTGPPGTEGYWTIEKTAELLGRTRSSINKDLNLAEVTQCLPELKKAKKKVEIQNASRQISGILGSANVLVHSEALTKTNQNWSIEHKDARDFMKFLPDGSVNIVLTDPPYEIDIASTMQEGFVKPSYDDTYKNLELYRILAEESFRFTVENAQGFVFCGPEYFADIREIFASVGWNSYVKPIIWYKGTGKTNLPNMWPISTYETILFFRKQKARIIRQPLRDFYQVTPLPSGQKIHQAEKPVTLLKELLNTISNTGDVLVDPFCGSGATVQAGLDQRLIIKACDMNKISVMTATNRILTHTRSSK